MKSISNQILAYILITLSVVFVACYFYSSHKITQFETQESEENNVRTCERLARFVVNPILRQDLKLIEEYIDVEALDENIRSIQILDQSNHLYAGVVSVKDKVNPIRGNRPIVLHQDSIVRPILYQGKTIGKVIFYSNKEPLQELLGKLKQMFILELFLIFLSITVLLSFVLKMVVINPLSTLKSWVSSINTDNSIPKPKLFHSTEVDTVIDSVFELTNRLISALKENLVKSSQISENESLLTSINKNLPGAMIYRLISDGKGSRKFTYLSGSFQKMYGHSVEEGMADPFIVYGSVVEEDTQSFWDAIAAALDNLSTFRCTLRMKNPDGTIRFSKFVATPTILEDGWICFDGVELDITELKKAQTELQESQFLLASITEGTPDIIFAKDIEGCFQYVNSAFLKNQNANREEVLGKNNFDVFSSDEAHQFSAVDYEVMESGEAQIFEEHLTTSSGNKVYLATKGPIKDAQGKTIGLFGIARDITALKKAETELQQSQFLLKSIAEGLPDSVFAKDLNGNLLFVNSALAKRANKSPEELLGKKNSAIFLRDDANKTLEKDLEIMKSGKTQTFEEQLDTASGSVVFLTTKGPIKDAQGNTVGLLGIARDITELKKTQADLQQSQFLLQCITEGSPDLIFAKDLDGRFLLVNSETAKRANKNPKELLGKNDFEVYPPDEAQKIMETDLKIMESGKTQTFEEILTTSSGNVVYLTTKGPIKDAEGKTVGLFGIARDITALKKAQTDLQENQFLLQSITEGLPDSIFAKDINGRFLFANSAVAKQANMSPKELLGKDNSVIFPSDEAKKTWEMDLEVMKSGKIQTFEEQVTTSSGNVVHLTTKGPIKDAQGKTIGLFGIGRDITERKRAEEALKVSQEKFEFAFNSSPDGILIQDEITGKYLETNSSITRIFGYNQEEFLFKSPLELNLYKDTKVREEVYEALKEKGYVRNMEILCRHKSGEDLHIIMTVERHYVDDKSFLYVTAQDVTERKQIELELQKLNLDKDRFISILGHDLRSPVNNVLLLLELLHTDLPNMEMEESKEIIDIAYKSAESTSNLLNDVLLWATSQSGKMKFDPQMVNFKGDCLNVIELLQTNANAKNIAIELHCEDALEVYVDKNMMDTVLRNLVSNALKFTHNGGEINIFAKKTTENTIISVTDNGVGIAPEDIDKIFDKTQLFTSIGTNAEKGTGFGLKLCQEFVEKHGGKIWVESEAGKGTSFNFSLPHSV